MLAAGDDPVVITGEPAELTMFLFGRDQHTGLKFEGPQDARRRAPGLGRRIGV